MYVATHRPQRHMASLVGGGQHGRSCGGVELEVHDTSGDDLQCLAKLSLTAA